MAQVAYKRGDLLLCESHNRLVEVEVKDVSQSARAVLTDVWNWMSVEDLHECVRGKLGHVTYERTGGFLLPRKLKRKVVRV